jgi:hypothetical protein
MHPVTIGLGVSLASIAMCARAGAAVPAEFADTLASGVWAYMTADGEVVVSGSFLGVPPDSMLLPEALAARRAFDFRRDDPVLGCGEPGMPRAFTAGSPMEFSWNGDSLTIHYESMDVVRAVDMARAAPPKDTPRSANGYAVGRWEDGALIVETSNLDGRVVDLLGTPKSDEMRLEERYRIETAGAETHLRVVLTMIDPGSFKEPYVWNFDFVLKPDWELLDYACEERPLELTPGVATD